MIKLIFLVQRKAGTSVEEFRRHWREVHGPLVAAIPGVQRYVQNHALPGPDGSSPPHDGYGELWVDSMEALATGMASPAGQVAAADGASFLDVSRAMAVSVEEVVLR